MRSFLDTVDTGLSQDLALYVAGEPWNDSASGVAVEYDAEGSSTLTFESREPLNGMEGASVRLDVLERDSLGRARPAPYFVGRLARPGKPESYYRREAVALGPFAQMEAQTFGEQVSYRGASVRRALYDIAARAQYPRGTVEVSGFADQLIDPSAEEAVFVEEVSLLEAATSLLETADGVMTDAPGGVAGRRRFLPRPRPGASERFVRSFGVNDYPSGGLEVQAEGQVSYSSVVVFRRKEDGTYAVRAEAPVRSDTAYPRGYARTHYVSEFVGTPEQGKQVAYDAARSLERQRPFTLSEVPFDAHVAPYDQVELVYEVERKDGTWQERYLAVVGELSCDLAARRMDLTGDALLTREEKLAPANIEIRRRRGVIPAVPLPREIPDWQAWGQVDLYLFELDKPFSEYP